jgi:cyclopropane fatty-acyl-phospholipid synthase-like methyltransferase
MKKCDNYWEIFSKENAYFYIVSDKKMNSSDETMLKHFFMSGEIGTEHSFKYVNKYILNREKALEIGCGIGRLTIPHSKLFKTIYAVDISETMLDKLRKNIKEKKINNIKAFLPYEAWDEHSNIDYAYSFIVFQHIEDISIIEDYIKRISLSLKKNGIAQLHFDTRHSSLLYKIRNLLPDFILPRTQRRGIRRIRRDNHMLKKMFFNCQLELISEMNACSENNIFVLKKI